jgi:hypothetical protein
MADKERHMKVAQHILAAAQQCAAVMADKERRMKAAQLKIAAAQQGPFSKDLFP